MKNSVRILVIDDSAQFRMLIGAYLPRELGEFEVVEYDPLAQGLPDNTLDWASFDLIILDYELGPAGTALDVLQGIADRNDIPPIILLSGQADVYAAVRTIKMGAYDFLDKMDLSPQRLGEMVLSAMSEADNRDHDDSAANSEINLEQDDRTVLLDSARVDRLEFGDQTITTTAARAAKLGAGADDSQAAENQYPEIPGYEISEQIGQGATAKAFLAKRQRDDMIVVLKLINSDLMQDGEFLDRFLQEAELVTGIDSPYVVKIHEQAFSDSGGFIAMEYLSGGDLKEKIKIGMQPADAVNYLLQIVQGLDTIHGVGIVHRDLKPANIMLRGDGSVAIVDFGISQHQGRAGDLTQVGMIMGTPHYMSPEQALGEQVDSRCDTYSAGVIFFEMLTGKRPFSATGDAPTAILYQHVNIPPPELPSELEIYQPVLDKMLAKSPAERFPNADTLITALKSCG